MYYLNTVYRNLGKHGTFRVLFIKTACDTTFKSQNKSSRALIKPGLHSINKIKDSITLIEHIFKRSKENMYATVGHKELTLEEVEGHEFVSIATSIVSGCKFT